MNLKDAKIIVTGASTGIGFETCKLLKSQGAQVVMASKNESRLQQAATDLELPYIVL